MDDISDYLHGRSLTLPTSTLKLTTPGTINNYFISKLSWLHVRFTLPRLTPASSSSDGKYSGNKTLNTLLRQLTNNLLQEIISLNVRRSQENMHSFPYNKSIKQDSQRTSE